MHDSEMLDTQHVSYAGYNPDAKPYKLQAIDRVAQYCEKEGITYGEYQRREFFGLLPWDVEKAGKPEVRIYIQPKKQNCHGEYHPNGRKGEKHKKRKKESDIL